MKVLAIDTASEACSVALLIEDKLFQNLEIMPTGHSKLILKMVDDVLNQAACGFKDLDVIAVDTGPGSFTGLRIGIGVAQGLAYGNNLPVIGVCSLEALTSGVDVGIWMPAIDARMNQIYCGLYEISNSPSKSRPAQLVGPVVVNPTELPFAVNTEINGLGSGWDAYADSIISGIPDFEVNWLANRYPEARQIAQIAQSMGKTSTINPLNLQASYIRNEVVKPA